MPHSPRQIEIVKVAPGIFFGNAEIMREACIDDAPFQDMPEMLRVAVVNAIEESKYIHRRLPER